MATLVTDEQAIQLGTLKERQKTSTEMFILEIKQTPRLTPNVEKKMLVEICEYYKTQEKKSGVNNLKIDYFRDELNPKFIQLTEAEPLDDFLQSDDVDTNTNTNYITYDDDLDSFYYESETENKIDQGSGDDEFDAGIDPTTESEFDYSINSEIIESDFVYTQKFFEEDADNEQAKLDYITDLQSQICKSNLRLIHGWIAKKYGFGYLVSLESQYGIQLGDLINHGYLGMMKCLENYNPYLCTFGTYSKAWVLQSADQHIAETTNALRQPMHIVRIKSKVNRFISSYIAQYELPPSTDEICEALKINEKDLLFLNAQKQSTSASIGDEDGYTLGDTLAAYESYSSDFNIQAAASKLQLEKFINNLRETRNQGEAKYVIYSMLFGLGEFSMYQPMFNRTTQIFPRNIATPILEELMRRDLIPTNLHLELFESDVLYYKAIIRMNNNQNLNGYELLELFKNPLIKRAISAEFRKFIYGGVSVLGRSIANNFISLDERYEKKLYKMVEKYSTEYTSIEALRKKVDDELFSDYRDSYLNANYKSALPILAKFLKRTINREIPVIRNTETSKVNIKKVEIEQILTFDELELLTSAEMEEQESIRKAEIERESVEIAKLILEAQEAQKNRLAKLLNRKK